MRGVLVVVAFLAGGCLRDALVDCGDGRTCPAGTTCGMIGEAPICATPEQLAACAGLQSFELCAFEDEPRACYESSAGLVCLPSGCGNALVDPGEVCDDANAITGDGCSVSCTSNETCGNGIVDPGNGEVCDDGDDVANDGCATGCDPESAVWSQIRFLAPEPLFGAGIAYDAARDRVVMFGGGFRTGQTGVPVSRDGTWEWDGLGWRQMTTPIAPAPRQHPMMAYDVARRRVVLFGGGASTGSIFDDTWEWDGIAWSRLSPASSPPGRLDGRVVYDPARERIVLFGGFDANGPLDDLWAWDGTTWEALQLSPRPAARGAHVMALDPKRGVIVVAGGRGSSGVVLDTWELDASGWRQLGVTTPSELFDTTAAFDGAGVVAFAPTANMWRYDGQSWAIALPANPDDAGRPKTRSYVSVVRDPLRDRVVMFGGVQQALFSTTYAETWLWNRTAWTLPAARPLPPARAAHASAYDAHRGRVVFFGGATGSLLGSPTPSGDTWELDPRGWIQRNGGPQARYGAAMAYDAARRVSVLFGGFASTNIGDTWSWNGTSWSQLSPASSPSARQFSAMAYDAARQRIVLFGGFSTAPSNDTWEWDGATWRELQPATKPSPRYQHVMAYDPIRARVVLFGGEESSRSADDAWEWDGTTWTQLASAQPPPARGLAGFAWHGTRGALALYGGSSKMFTAYDDVWELAGGAWTQIALTPIAERQAPSFTPAPDGRSTLVFGGALSVGSLDPTNELWQLRWQTTARYELCTLVVDDDGDGLAGCADPDCWATCTPFCPPGAPCDASAPRCGDIVCDPTETCRICEGDCGACTPICGDTFCEANETGCPGDC